MSDILVSVVTPFYNTEPFLAECIESVLGQTLDRFEYLLVDNASTDGSLAVAESFARKDPRIRVVHFDEHLDQLPNYNRALQLSDPAAPFCKMAQADDVLMPSCLEEMVRLAESDPDIVMVGAYTLLQDSVFLDGLDYYESVLDGAEICRRYLLGGPYILGSPTTCMYRMDTVRATPEFYPPTSKLGDADAAMRILQGRKFGFVHQILSFVRTSNESISNRRAQFHFNALTRRVLLEKYGPLSLEKDELDRERKRLSRRHYRVLGEGVLLRRPEPFWNLHREGLAEVGLRISRPKVWFGALVVAIRWVFNLEATIRRNWSWS